MEEVLQNAKETGTIRRPSVDGVLKILAPDSKHRLTARQLSGLPKRATPAWAGNPSLGGGPNTSRLSNLHLTLVQMGGAIDKDFSLHPEGTISDPASVKILDSMLCGFTYDFVSVAQSLRVLQKHRCVGYAAGRELGWGREGAAMGSRGRVRGARVPLSHLDCVVLLMLRVL